MNKYGDYIAYYFVLSTNLHVTLGKYDNRADAIKALYYALACYVNEQEDPRNNYALSPLYFLGGGTDLGVDVLRIMPDSTRIEVTGYIMDLEGVHDDE